MSYYCGIDLHSINHVVCVSDEEDKRVLERMFSNDSSAPLIAVLSEYKTELKAIAIESTFNWYWLVDDLQACLLYTSPSPRDQRGSRMPSSA